MQLTYIKKEESKGKEFNIEELYEKHIDGIRGVNVIKKG